MENEIGIKIKKLRTKLNLSQNRFGNRIGVSGKTVSAYECGKCVPTVRIMEKITTAFKVELIYTQTATQNFFSRLQDIQCSIQKLHEDMTNTII